MAKQDPSREEALRRLDAQADALAQRTARPEGGAAHGQAVNQAYRIVVELFAGVLVGLGLGAAVDWLAGTRPWGLIAGVLLGFGVSVWMAGQTARRLSAQAKADTPSTAAPAVVDDDEES